MICSNILQKHLSAIWNMNSRLARPIPAQCTVKPTTCRPDPRHTTEPEHTSLSIYILPRWFDDADDAVTQTFMKNIDIGQCFILDLLSSNKVLLDTFSVDILGLRLLEVGLTSLI